MFDAQRHLEGKPRTPLSSRVATRVSWSPLSGLKGVQTTGISAFLLGWPWEAQSSPRIARDGWGLRSGENASAKGPDGQEFESPILPL